MFLRYMLITSSSSRSCSHGFKEHRGFFDFVIFAVNIKAIIVRNYFWGKYPKIFIDVLRKVKAQLIIEDIGIAFLEVHCVGAQTLWVQVDNVTKDRHTFYIQTCLKNHPFKKITLHYK